jgi:RimJ/RimL family protein N-acetyltransferase
VTDLTFSTDAVRRPPPGRRSEEPEPRKKMRWQLPDEVEVTETAAGIEFRCDGGDKYFVRELAPDDCAALASWLANPAVHAWMDFGGGRQQLDALSIRVMAGSPDHFVRVVHDAAGRALGVFGLQQVRHPFGVAHFWGVRAMLRPPARMRVAVAMRIVLSLALRTHVLSSIQAWAVDGNLRSVRILEELGFRAAGRHRRCHAMGGELRDRLLFDLLPDELESTRDVAIAAMTLRALAGPVSPVPVQTQVQAQTQARGEHAHG